MMNISTKALLKMHGVDTDLNNLNRKEKRKISKKIKRVLKEIEFMRRVGGLTVVREGECVITTYFNNSLDRGRNINKNKVIY